MSEPTIRILLVDDHQILRDGLRALLESEADMRVTAEAATGQMAIQQALLFQPDVIVMDLGLPDMSGLDAIREIRQRGCASKIVVLSMHSERKFVLQAIEAGCDGYVPKSSAHDSLLQAIRVVHSGDRFLHPKAATVLLNSIAREKSESDHLAELSERELDVIRLTARGFTSREIGESFSISSKTVDTYRQRAMEKLGLEHRSDLIRFALQAGLLDDFKQP